MNMENRVEKLESLLLPKPDFLPDLYDALIQMEIATFSTEAEAILKLGDKELWCNDMRRN